MIQFNLPYPPTLNNLFKNVRNGRVKTAEYDAWIQAARLLLMAQRPGSQSGSFRATIILGKPDRRRRDIDNTVKAIMDLITKAGVIEDDCLAQSITVAWAWDTIVPGGSVTVAIEPSEFPIFLLGKAA